jgi:3-methyladenine DNA glycosylase AlkD
VRDWAAGIESWPHSDGLSAFYARALEAHPSRIYPTLAKWNRARNSWLRRQSIVSLIYYASARKTVQPIGCLLPLVENLLTDPDVYIQKGIGWTLREIGNVYPEAHRAFLDARVTALSSVAFSAATEKLTPQEKAPYKARRASARRKSVAG